MVLLLTSLKMDGSTALGSKRKNNRINKKTISILNIILIRSPGLLALRSLGPLVFLLFYFAGPLLLQSLNLVGTWT